MENSIKYFILVFTTLLFFSSSAHEEWMKAQNLRELHQIIRNQKEYEKLKILCQLQLKKKIIPVSCYEWIKIKPLLQQNQSLAFLDEKCKEFSAYLRNPKKIIEILYSKHLSPFCRKTISQQKKMIEYQLRDHIPIFNRYLEEGF